MGSQSNLRKRPEQRSALRRIRKDTNGAVLMEFAFVAVPFITLLLAILQTALIFYANQLIDTATQSVSREILTGNAQKTAMTQAQFKAKACAKLPSFMSCNNLTVDVSRVGTFASANTASPTATYSNGTPQFQNRWEPGAEQEIIMVRLMYPWNVVGAPNGLDLASLQNGQFLLVGTIITRSEPFS